MVMVMVRVGVRLGLGKGYRGYGMRRGARAIRLNRREATREATRVVVELWEGSY